MREVLGKTHLSDFEKYCKENKESLILDEDSFYVYIKELLSVKKITQQSVFLKADIPERYGYKLLSGEKHTKQRDIILRICYAGELSLDETQRALKKYGMAELYPKVPRDALLMIIFILVFEVPEDAQEIEVEYETNFITDAKLKFVYDGDKDSGYVVEANTTASENAFAVGDIVESNEMNISYISCEKDESFSEYSKPDAGYHYVTLSFEFENKSDSDQGVTYYDFDCYADGRDCDQAFYRDDGISATLSAGRKAKGTVTFMVPDDATVVEVEYLANYWTSSRVVFTVSE